MTVPDIVTLRRVLCGVLSCAASLLLDVEQLRHVEQRLWQVCKLRYTASISVCILGQLDNSGELVVVAEEVDRLVAEVRQGKCTAV